MVGTSQNGLLELPADFVVDRLGPIGRRQSGRLRGIRGSPQGVRAHVGDGCSLHGRPGGRSRGRALHFARGTARNKPPADPFGGAELAASKGSGSADSVAGTIIFRSLCLKQGHDSLSAVRGPSCDNAALGLG